MMLITVNSFCCGCNLKTGGRIIAVVFGIISLTAVVLITIAAKQYGAFRGTTDSALIQLVRALYGFHIAVAVVSAFQILANIILLFGTQNEAPQYLRLWMWVYSISMCLDVIMGISAASVSFSKPLIGYDIPGVFLFFIAFFSCVPKIYCLVIVYSLYYQLLGNRHEPLKSSLPENHSYGTTSCSKDPAPDSKVYENTKF